MLVAAAEGMQEVGGAAAGAAGPGRGAATRTELSNAETQMTAAQISLAVLIDHVALALGMTFHSAASSTRPQTALRLATIKHLTCCSKTAVEVNQARRTLMPLNVSLAINE